VVGGVIVVWAVGSGC